MGGAGSQLAWHELNEPLRLIRAPIGLISSVRDSVDLLPRDGDDAWRNIAARLAAIPVMFASWRTSLEAGLGRGLTAARRQAEQAYRGYADMARYLREDYAPRATEVDAVGAERYAVAARLSLGADIDHARRISVPRRPSGHRHRRPPGPAAARWLPVDLRAGREVLGTAGRAEPHQIHAEVVRYFGWPGQAISYKLGERAWLAARAEAAKHPGFDLKRWHTAALGLGPIGLDGLRETLSGA